MDEKLLTVKQAAEYLQVTTTTILRWIKGGRIEGAMPGGTKTGYRIPIGQIDGLVKQRPGRQASGDFPRRVATNAVMAAIRSGKLAPPSTQACERCGAPAQAYHHTHGYAPEHRLTVQPLCTACHHTAHGSFTPEWHSRAGRARMDRERENARLAQLARDAGLA